MKKNGFVSTALIYTFFILFLLLMLFLLNSYSSIRFLMEQYKYDIKKLENCFNTLISRHESLRTYFVFEKDNVVQKIAEKINFKLEIQENADFDELNLIFKDFVKPFDLSKAPLFITKLVKLNDNKMLLLLDMHHIISDGTSLGILLQELCEIFECWI